MLLFLGLLAAVIVGGVIGGILLLILLDYAIKATIAKKLW